MAAVAAPVVAPRSRSRRTSLRRTLAWHPECWVYAVAGAAWVALVWISLRPAGHVHGFAATWVSSYTHWLLMVPAMMLPVVAPHVRAVGLRSVWSRRHWSTVVFVLAYLVVWSLVGAALVAAVASHGVGHHGSPLL